MDEQTKADFLRRRMSLLREKNKCSLSQMALLLHKDKSTLSRIEKIGGTVSLKKVEDVAKEYCAAFKMSAMQTDEFLRGAKAVVVDTSAIINRHNVLDELCEEYSYVCVPSFAVDDLAIIENNNPNDFGRTASLLLKSIIEDERIHTNTYSIPTDSGFLIIDIAREVSKECACNVDIITFDYRMAIHIREYAEKDPAIQLLYLDDYVADKQGLVNMRMLNAINEYYSDSYEDIVEKLDISLPSKNSADNYLDSYLMDGNTLIISAVNNTAVPVEQRKRKIQWLLENGANINKRDCGDEYLPPISHSIRNRDYGMFTFLYRECNADPNVGSKYPFRVGKRRYKNNGNMPLMIAAWNNQVDIVRDLCADSRVSLNQQDGKNGFTALIKACYWGNLECRKIIEEAGADTSILDHSGLSAQDRWKECLALGRYKERETDDRQSMHFHK